MTTGRKKAQKLIPHRSASRMAETGRYTADEIIQMTGVSRSWLYSQSKKNGWNIPSRASRKRKLVLWLLKEGYSVDVISEKTGIRPETVQNIKNYSEGNDITIGKLKVKYHLVRDVRH